MHILFRCIVECLHDYRLTLITLNDITISWYKQLTREKLNLSHLPYIFTEHFCIEKWSVFRLPWSYNFSFSYCHHSRFLKLNKKRWKTRKLPWKCSGFVKKLCEAKCWKAITLRTVVSIVDYHRHIVCVREKLISLYLLQQYLISAINLFSKYSYMQSN